MHKKDLTDYFIEQGYIKPFNSPYVLDRNPSSFDYTLDGDSTFEYSTDEEPRKEEKDRA